MLWTDFAAAASRGWRSMWRSPPVSRDPEPRLAPPAQRGRVRMGIVDRRRARFARRGRPAALGAARRAQPLLLRPPRAASGRRPRRRRRGAPHAPPPRRRGRRAGGCRRRGLRRPGNQSIGATRRQRRPGDERGMTDEVTVGLVGCGRLAEAGYLPALDRVAGAALVAVADPDPTRRARVADLASAQTGGRPVRAHPDLQALLDDDQLDALILATPVRPAPRRRPRRAAAGGRRVLVEKPPAPDADTAGRAGRARPGRRGSGSTAASTPRAAGRARRRRRRRPGRAATSSSATGAGAGRPSRCTTTPCSTSGPTSSTGPAGSPAARSSTCGRSSSRPERAVLTVRHAARRRPADRGDRLGCTASASWPARRRELVARQGRGGLVDGGARPAARRRAPARRHARRRARRVRRVVRGAATPSGSAPRPTDGP